MHRCLKIPELVETIFSNLTTGFEGDGKVLAALARTCRTFHDPALDILWKEPNDLMNILRCLPSDVFTVKRDPVSYRPTLKLLRPVVTRDWDRPLVYMPRVKILGFPSFENSQCSEIFPSMERSLPTSCLFPNLVTFRWSAVDFPYIHLFLTPTITSIRVLCIPLIRIPSLLPTLSLTCRRLKDVEIELDGNALRDMTDISRPSFSAFVHQLSLVEHLSMPPSDSAAMEHVGQLETLRFLYLPTLPAQVLHRSIERPSLFVNLSTLIIGTLNITTATRVITRCTDTAFHTLRLTFDTSPTPEVTCEFYTALAKCRRSHASLRSLSLENRSDDEPDLVRETFLVRNETIQRLFCFRNLTEIELVSPCGFELNDRTCALMAHAWPHVECLTLKEHYYPRQQSVTLELLRSFAHHCPALTKLHITFDARVVPGPIHLQLSQINLEHLHVGHALIDAYDPRPAARFISSIFPQLKCIATAQDYRGLDGDYDEDEEDDAPLVDVHSWYDVQERLPGRRAMYAR
ncbi:hypothetical protein C8R44DRAFT_753785 [Mycena epipterygia]|nr:hypothetical protein C8R44DRAFT_753785 [Mycena epipterygia]